MYIYTNTHICVYIYTDAHTYVCAYTHTHTHTHTHTYIYIYIYIYSPGGSDGKESVYNAGDPGSITGLGRSPAEGNGNPL